MEFEILEKTMNGIIILKTPLFGDKRGFFSEVYRKDKFEELGIPYEFIQDNHSGSERGVLRGLHFQWAPPMGKLVRVTQGDAYLVAVDIRKNSPTLGGWYGIEASRENKIQFWAPAGFARGFCVLSDYSEIQYKCTGTYNSQAESGILWNDHKIGIKWPITNPILSEKDKNAQTLEEWLKKPESNKFKLL